MKVRDEWMRAAGIVRAERDRGGPISESGTMAMASGFTQLWSREPGWDQFRFFQACGLMVGPDQGAWS